MKKTSKSYCKKCKYHSVISGGAIACYYIAETGKRRACPIGYCDKFEKPETKRRTKK